MSLHGRGEEGGAGLRQRVTRSPLSETLTAQWREEGVGGTGGWWLPLEPP